MRTTDPWLDSIWPLHPPPAAKGIEPQRGLKKERTKDEAQRSVRARGPLEHHDRPAMPEITLVVKK